MPPKGKEKPKTKKELREEAEAAARAAEEERLRQEEEATGVAEQVEQRRRELLAEYTSQRDAKLARERRELVPVLQELQRRRADMAAYKAAAADWEGYLSCSPLPDPRDRPAMNDFINSILQEADARDVQKTLQHCEACLQLAEQCLTLAAEEDMEASLLDALNTFATGPAGSSCSPEPAQTPQQDGGDACGSSGSSGGGVGDSSAAVSADGATALLQVVDAEQDAAADPGAARLSFVQPAASPASAAWDPASFGAACAGCRARAGQYQQDASVLYNGIRSLVDTATAYLLHRADEYADPKGDVLLTAQQGLLQWGLWVNTQKNPRFKLVDLAGLGMSVEIPKQLALANIALRVQRQPFHERSSTSRASVADGQPAAAGGCLAPLGGVLHVDLLTLPPPAKNSMGWTVRQVSPQSGCISAVPYPIPPIGADPSMWRPEEEPPPLTFSVRLPERLLVPSVVRVGWWDDSQQAWSEEGISNAAYDAATGRLSFSSTKLGCLALLQDTSAHLPYNAWVIRPTGGLGGANAVIDLQVPGLPSDDCSAGATVSVEVGSGWAKLRGPSLPQLGHLLGRPLPPWELLVACEACGLSLSPGSRQLALRGLAGKCAAAEQAMCADLAGLCTKFLVASSCWNRDVGRDVLLVRLSEVTDWEEGGRTSSAAAQRIFSKEAAEGPCRVMVARREGALGVAWTDGGDSRPEPPAAPDLSTIAAVQAAMQEEVLHASLLHLLAQRHQAQEGEHPAEEEDCGSVESRALACGDVDAGLQSSLTQLLLAMRVFAAG